MFFIPTYLAFILTLHLTPSSTLPSTDDSWLQITPDALDDFLESKYGKNNIPRGASEKEMMDSLSAFMGHMSDLEGAEVPQRKMSTLSTPKRKASKGGKKLSTSLLGQHHLRKVSAQSTASDVSNCSEMSSFSNKVDFNAEAFSDAMANILGKDEGGCSISLAPPLRI